MAIRLDAAELRCSAGRGALQGQGAIEYLVLLAVVLIVALVSVALLGFFPGMASDAQIMQSQTYWQAASPIAIVEVVASLHTSYGTYNFTEAFFRIRKISNLIPMPPRA